MSRKQRTTIRRKNYRAWKQEHKQDSRPPSIAKPIDDNAPSSAHEPIDQAALIHELRSPHISSDVPLPSHLEIHHLILLKKNVR